MSDLFQPEILLALLALGVAFATGPSVLLARGVLRAGFAPGLARARGAGLASGMAGGAMLAVLACGASIGPEAAVAAAVLTLLAFLATMDILWRWLPLEWTLPLLALGLGSAAFQVDLLSSVMGAALGAGILFALRLSFQFLRGVEALGLGDVWLAAALGAHVGPDSISWLLGAAALLGIVLHMAIPSPQSKRYGVAFGAQLCAVAPIFVYF